MKTHLLITLIVFSVNTLFAQSVFEQISAVNANWQTIGCYDDALKREAKITGEQQLIQAHLQAAIDYLAQQVPALNKQQASKRSDCLRILQGYANAGCFPVNTCHTERTPYFIDSYGTYCAVGYLLQQTGYDGVAQRVHKEMNYAYIGQIPLSYIGNWAKEYGFTEDELALIQPTYSPMLRCYNDTFYVGNSTPTPLTVFNNDFYSKLTGSGCQFSTLILSMLKMPEHGNANVVETATDTFIVYESNAGYTGWDSLQYVVLFGDTGGWYCGGRLDTASVYINVLSDNGNYITYKKGDADYNGVINGLDVLYAVKNVGEISYVPNSADGNCKMEYAHPWSGSMVNQDEVASDINADGKIDKNDIILFPTCGYQNSYSDDYAFYNDRYSLKIMPYDTLVTQGKDARIRCIVYDEIEQKLVPIRGVSTEVYHGSVSAPYIYYPNVSVSPVSAISNDIVRYSSFIDGTSASSRKFVLATCLFYGESNVIEFDTFSVFTDLFNVDDITDGKMYSISLTNVYILSADNEIIRLRRTSARYTMVLSTDVSSVGIYNIGLFPNPTSSSFTITLSQQPQPSTTMLIYNAIGALVKQEEFNEATQQIDIAELPDGMYTYAVLNSGLRQGSGKLIVSH